MTFHQYHLDVRLLVNDGTEFCYSLQEASIHPASEKENLFHITRDRLLRKNMEESLLQIAKKGKSVPPRKVRLSIGSNTEQTFPPPQPTPHSATQLLRYRITTSRKIHAVNSGHRGSFLLYVAMSGGSPNNGNIRCRSLETSFSPPDVRTFFRRISCE